MQSTTKKVLLIQKSFIFTYTDIRQKEGGIGGEKKTNATSNILLCEKRAGGEDIGWASKSSFLGGRRGYGWWGKPNTTPNILSYE